MLFCCSQNKDDICIADQQFQVVGHLARDDCRCGNGHSSGDVPRLDLGTGRSPNIPLAADSELSWRISVDTRMDLGGGPAVPEPPLPIPQ